MISRQPFKIGAQAGRKGLHPEENHRIGLCVCPVAPTGVTGALTGLPVSSGLETGGRGLQQSASGAGRLVPAPRAAHQPPHRLLLGIALLHFHAAHI